MISLDLASPSALTSEPGLTGTVKAFIDCEVTVNAGHVSSITLGKDFNYRVIKVGDGVLALMAKSAAA